MPSHYDIEQPQATMQGLPSPNQSQQGAAPQQDPADDSGPQQQNVSQQSHQSSADQQGGGQQPQQSASAQQPVSQTASAGKQATLDSLLEIYEEPDAYAGLYNYAKALEEVEAGLLAGFFFKHYCLASNVIGSQSKGDLYRCTLCISRFRFDSNCQTDSMIPCPKKSGVRTFLQTGKKPSCRGVWCAMSQEHLMHLCVQYCMASGLCTWH